MPRAPRHSAEQDYAVSVESEELATPLSACVRFHLPYVRSFVAGLDVPSAGPKSLLRQLIGYPQQLAADSPLVPIRARFQGVLEDLGRLLAVLPFEVLDRPRRGL